MNRCFFDVETTGLDVERSAIIEAHFHIEPQGSPPELFSELNLRIKPHPHALVTEEALKINKRTPADLLEGEWPLDACIKIEKFFASFVSQFDKKDGLELIGFNSLAFDTPILKAMFERCKRKYFNAWFLWPGIDVACLAQYCLGNEYAQMPSKRLAAVAQRFGVEVDAEKLHGARYDVELTRQIYHKINYILRSREETR